MDYKETNREAWNIMTRLHVNSDFYNVQSFKDGNCTLKEIELSALSDVRGKELLHLQCHFGMDTMSWARRGANATGVDLSTEAIQTAKKLSDELNIPANFICSDIYDFGNANTNTYDIVYTSYGVLSWLNNLEAWANIIANALNKGGIFFIAEFHPSIWLMEGASYFPQSEGYIEEMESYTDQDGKAITVQFPHSLSEIISALLKAGLKITSFNEYPYSPYDVIENAEEREKGRWYRQYKENDEPLLFSLTATKE